MKTDIHTVPFTDPWLLNIKLSFEKRNMQVESFTVMNRQKDDLSLKKDDESENINQAIMKFHPECVMVISLTKIEAYSGVQIGRPGSNGADFDMKLFNFTDPETPIWRAKLTVFGQYGISTAVDNGTKRFISQLEKDKIIALLPN